jgi:coenzyme F420-reducing hydrogenase alpha subunit
VDIEGKLQITLSAMNGTVTNAHIASTRPLQVASLFHGKSVDETLRTLPLLYSLCGTAQACSAVRACEQALGLRAGAATTAARDLLVWVETAREHLWRILLDWPGFVGERSDKAALAGVSGLLLSCKTALFSGREPFQLHAEPVVDHDALTRSIDALTHRIETAVFGGAPEQWLSCEDDVALRRWSEAAATPAARLIRHVRECGWQSIGATETAFLPALDEERLLRCLRGDYGAAFVGQPRWDDRCRETTPLARQRDHVLVRALASRYGAGLLVRLVARLVELARIPGYLRHGAKRLKHGENTAAEQWPAPGFGLGQVEAARGRLVHYVETEGQVIRRYRILAPTEWNFHPEGVVARGLCNVSPAPEEQLRQQAALWIGAIDPCVGYTLRIH